MALSSTDLVVGSQWRCRESWFGTVTITKVTGERVYYDYHPDQRDTRLIPLADYLAPRPNDMPILTANEQVSNGFWIPLIEPDLAVAAGL